MAKINSAYCKTEIIKFLNGKNAASILAMQYSRTTDIKYFVQNCDLFDSNYDEIENTTIDDILKAVRNPKNWKRICKEKVSKYCEIKSPVGNDVCCRTFNCVPFEDQLRGYVYDDGVNILLVSVEGE